MSSNLQCPVDFVTINENKARVTAFFVLLLVISYLLSQIVAILVMLAIDFLLRAINKGKYSALGFLSDAVVRQLKIKNKPVDRGPKRFAAWVGLGFLVSVLMLTALQFNLAATVMVYLLIVFAALEAFAGFCAGCYVYTFGLLILKNNRSKNIQKMTTISID